jgi:hypothetical protein
VDYTSAKHKLTWCCLQCCMIGASNSMVSMQLIEGSNQMDYPLVVLYFHDWFPSQMIWAYHWEYATLCNRSMIAFACGWYAVTYIIGLTSMPQLSWIHIRLNSRLNFPILPLSKTIKLRSLIMCQPGVMKQILDGWCWLIFFFDNFKPTSGWIYHRECKQRVCFGWCPCCKWTR